MMSCITHHPDFGKGLNFADLINYVKPPLRLELRSAWNVFFLISIPTVQIYQSKCYISREAVNKQYKEECSVLGAKLAVTLLWCMVDICCSTANNYSFWINKNIVFQLAQGMVLLFWLQLSVEGTRKGGIMNIYGRNFHINPDFIRIAKYRIVDVITEKYLLQAFDMWSMLDYN